MSEIVSLYLISLANFGLYFGGSLVLAAGFLKVYTWITPQDEWTLIRAGNSAAALSLAGAGLGFVIPLASTIANSLNFRDMVIWGVVAMLVQLVTFVVARRLMPRLPEDIAEGRMACAVASASLSVGVGVLNAACMTY